MYLASFMGGETQRRMEATVENSPWHREANVWVHTKMVMDEYRTRFAPFRGPIENNIALFALLYHDVGKPDAEEVKEKKDGSGVYRSYAGHEQNSAVAFMEEYLKNPFLRQVLPLEHARIVRWIIEHHLPYDYKDKQKRRALRTAMAATLADVEGTFYDCLRSDAAGRISDDHATKLARVEDWIAEFQALEQLEIKPTREQVLYIMVGPSGSGKSTWVANHMKDGDEVVSMDTMKLEYFSTHGAAEKNAPEHFANDHEFYDAAWQYCTIDNQAAFNKFAGARVNEQMQRAAKAGKNVFFDIVNSSRRRRQAWVDLGRRYGFKIVGVEFWNTLETLVARQKTRPDHSVPEKSIRQQQYATTCMWLGYECEDVVLAMGETKNA